MLRTTWIALCLLLALTLALGADDAAVARGKKLFHDTQDLEYASCALCHSLLPPKEERKSAGPLGPGHTLYGAAVREGWRGMSTYADVGEAAQYCAKAFQKRKGGLKAAQRADLIAFLKTHAPKEPLPKRDVEKRPRLMKVIGVGDAAKGKELVKRYCAGCHSEDADALSFELKPNRKKKTLILRKVRGYDQKGRFKPRSGSMGYYTTDRLSDEDLRHIIAYAGR